MTIGINTRGARRGSWRRDLGLLAAAGLAAIAGACSSSNIDGGSGGAGGQLDGGAGGQLDAGAGGQLDAGAGGRGGGAGTDAGGDAPPLTTLSFAFDTNSQGFDVDRTITADPINLGVLSVDGGSLVTSDFDPLVGSPAPGSLHIDATFTDYNQVAAVRRVYPNSLAINLTGRTITAQIRLDADPDGGSAAFSGQARLFALSTPTLPVGFFLAEGGSVLLTDNAWHTMTFLVSAPEFSDPRFDSTDVVQIGIHLVTPAPVAPDGSAPPFGAPQSISIHFDTLVSD
jgi:hypothetical protein